jgi:hypothetical protein
MFQTKVGGRIKTHFKSSTPPPENRAVCEMTWKNVVELGIPQMTIWRMRIVCWMVRLQIRTQNIYCLRFSTATMVTRTRRNITLYVHCLHC